MCKPLFKGVRTELTNVQTTFPGCSDCRQVMCKPWKCLFIHRLSKSGGWTVVTTKQCANHQAQRSARLWSGRFRRPGLAGRAKSLKTGSTHKASSELAFSLDLYELYLERQAARRHLVSFQLCKKNPAWNRLFYDSRRKRALTGQYTVSWTNPLQPVKLTRERKLQLF